jgi:hypothetical protein
MMKLHLKSYTTGWDKEWKTHAGQLQIEAHAPSQIVLKAGESGNLRLTAKLRNGGRNAASVWVNGDQVDYGQPVIKLVVAGQEIVIEARVDGNRDQCWNYWQVENALISCPGEPTISFWAEAHLGDSLGMLIACENFALQNGVVLKVAATPLMESIMDVFLFDHVRLAPHSPDMVHVHPFGYDFEKLGWIIGITKALKMSLGGEMPERVLMPQLRNPLKPQKEDVILLQFDGRSGGVWPRNSILAFLRQYDGHKMAVLGGPDTSRYMGDLFEYRTGKLPFIVEQLLSCTRFIGTDSGLAHLACVLGLKIDLLPSPTVSVSFVRGLFSSYPKAPRILPMKETRLVRKEQQRLLLVSTTNGWNLGDDLIRQGVMRLLNVGGLDPVVWINRAQVSVRDEERRCDWSPLWSKLCNFGDPRTLVESAKALIVAGTPEWIDTIQPFYRLAVESGLPIWIIGVGGGQEGQVHHLKQPHEQGCIHVATARDDAARRAIESVGQEVRRFLDPAFHADPYQPTDHHLYVFNPRLQTEGHRDFYRRLYDEIKDKIDVITHTSHRQS